MTATDRVLNLLSDGRIHYSAEFRDKLGLLEYRKRLSELRDRGLNIISMKYKASLWEKARPAYKLVKGEDEKTQDHP